MLELQFIGETICKLSPHVYMHICFIICINIKLWHKTQSYTNKVQTNHEVTFLKYFSRDIKTVYELTIAFCIIVQNEILFTLLRIHIYSFNYTEIFNNENFFNLYKLLSIYEYYNWLIEKKKIILPIWMLLHLHELNKLFIKFSFRKNVIF